MSDKKYLPVRTCIGCGKKAEKSEFIRIANDKNGFVTIGADNFIFGRSAYVCNNLSCVLKAEKKKRLARTLRTDNCEDVYEKLKKIMGEENGSNI